MMKNVYFAFLAAFAFLLVACDKPQKPTATTTATNTNVQQPIAKSVENGTRGRTFSGYEYVHHLSKNTEKPQEGDRVKYHKIVYKNDTTLLQSTYYMLEPRADVMISRDSIKGTPHPTYDALFLMSPGDSLTVYQTMDTFPPARLPEGITVDDRFSYILKLLSIKKAADVTREINMIKGRHVSVSDSLRAFVKAYKAGSLDNQLKTTESGLKYYLHRQGAGKKVKDGGFVKVHYVGILEDGSIFDSTFPKARPFPTRIGRKRVIAGWDEGIPLLNEGGAATFIVPYQLAYGIAGKPPGIPERADLYFYIDLMGVY